MKKILFFLALLFSVSLVFAQHPIGTDSLPLQTLGSAKTFVKSKNLIGADSGYVNAHYPDTATANFYKVSKYPGGQIMVGDDVWVRNITATAWILVGSGGGSGGTPNLQQVTDVGYTTTNPLISYNSVAVIGADTIDNLNSVSSPSKGVISTNILLSQNPALTWTLPWNTGPTNLFADSSDAKNLQLPNANGFLALSVNGIPADVNGNIIDTSRRTDTAFIIQTIHDSLVLRGPDTTILIFPLYALNDSTFAIKRDSLPRFDYSVSDYDTTTWLPLTLITKQYLEDRIGSFGAGGSQTIDQTLRIGNTTRQTMIWEDSVAVAGTGITFTQYKPRNYGTVYPGAGTASGFHQSYAYYPGVNADGRPNVVGRYWQYNGGVGNRTFATEQAFTFGTETHYQLSGGAATELHLPEFEDTLGNIRRLSSFYILNASGYATQTQQVDNYVKYTGRTDTANWAVSPTSATLGFNTNTGLTIANMRVPTNSMTITVGDTGPQISGLGGVTPAATYLQFGIPAIFGTNATIGTTNSAAITASVGVANFAALRVVQSGLGSSDFKGIAGDFNTSGTFTAMGFTNSTVGGNTLSTLSSNGGTARYQLFDGSNSQAWNITAATGTLGHPLYIGVGNDSSIKIMQTSKDVYFKYNVAIGSAAPTARLHLAAGTTAASTAPLKFTTASAALLTTPEAGAMEVLVDSLFYTGAAGTRYKVYPQSSGAALTFSTGLTNTANTITANLSTGIAGGQRVLGGTAANDTLTVQGNSAASGNTLGNANIRFRVGDNGATVAATILNNGKVGIGNTAPASLLDVGTFNTSFYNIRTGSFLIQPLSLNNGFLSENLYYNGGWQRNATGYGEGFQFFNGQTMIHAVNTGAAGGITQKIQVKSDYTGAFVLGADINANLGTFTGATFYHSSTGLTKMGNATLATSTLQVDGSFAPAYIAKGASYTATISDHTIEVTATGQTITLPTAVGISGREYVIKLTASGTGTVATTSSQTIDGSTTYSLSAQYKYVTVQSNNANWIIIANN